MEHRIKYGLAETFAYTWSKAIDNVGEMTSVAGTMGAVTNTYCLPCDRSRSDQNEPTVIRWSTRYELPFGAQKPFLNQGFIKHVAGGWTVSGIYHVRLGPSHCGQLQQRLRSRQFEYALASQLGPRRLRSSLQAAPTST